jgi:hypothetical protein
MRVLLLLLLLLQMGKHCAFHLLLLPMLLQMQLLPQ